MIRNKAYIERDKFLATLNVVALDVTIRAGEEEDKYKKEYWLGYKDSIARICKLIRKNENDIVTGTATKDKTQKPKYIVKRINGDGIGFYVINETLEDVYLAEQFDQVPLSISLSGFVSDFDPDEDINACELYEIKKEDVTDSELFFTQKGAIAAAFRMVREDQRKCGFVNERR